MNDSIESLVDSIKWKKEVVDLKLDQLKNTKQNTKKKKRARQGEIEHLKQRDKYQMVYQN